LSWRKLLSLRWLRAAQGPKHDRGVALRTSRLRFYDLTVLAAVDTKVQPYRRLDPANKQSLREALLAVQAGDAPSACITSAGEL